MKPKTVHWLIKKLIKLTPEYHVEVRKIRKKKEKA